MVEVGVLTEPPTVSIRCSLGKLHIQGDSGRKVNVLGGDGIGHCEKKKVSMHMCLIMNGYRR